VERHEALGRTDVGAVVADSPRAVVEGAEFAVAMVCGEEASRRIWLDTVDGALAGLRREAVLLESSALSMSWVGQLARLCAEPAS
jgi:3-hydroxyisobutyrate dehydrogenase-like beta-hydroxyacid dehydrogenase